MLLRAAAAGLPHAAAARCCALPHAPRAAAAPPALPTRRSAARLRPPRALPHPQATTPLDPRVIDAMLPFMTEQYGNPHSRTHLYGWEAEDAVEAARAQVGAGACAGAALEGRQGARGRVGVWAARWRRRARRCGWGMLPSHGAGSAASLQRRACSHRPHSRPVPDTGGGRRRGRHTSSAALSAGWLTHTRACCSTSFVHSICRWRA